MKFYNPLSAVLGLYFKFLKYPEDTATVLFHSFVSLCYFAPILGATLADSFLGKFRTIFYLSIVYIIGELTLTLGAIGDRSNGNEGIEGMPAA
jgi:dipeptide/tripeptide permease